MKSWKTTLGGIASLLSGLAGLAHAVSVGDYSNLPVLLAAITSGAGLIFARDNKVTSEQAGAK